MQDRGDEIVNQGVLIAGGCLVLTLLISQDGSALHQLVWMGERVRYLVSGVRRAGTSPVGRVVERRLDERRIQVLENGGRGLLGEVGFSANQAAKNFENESRICVLCHNPGCGRGLALDAAPPVQYHRVCCSRMSWPRTHSRGWWTQSHSAHSHLPLAFERQAL